MRVVRCKGPAGKGGGGVGISFDPLGMSHRTIQFKTLGRSGSMELPSVMVREVHPRCTMQLSRPPTCDAQARNSPSFLRERNTSPCLQAARDSDIFFTDSRPDMNLLMRIPRPKDNSLTRTSPATPRAPPQTLRLSTNSQTFLHPQSRLHSGYRHIRDKALSHQGAYDTVQVTRCVVLLRPTGIFDSTRYDES
jgi:hypothetical protein